MTTASHELKRASFDGDLEKVRSLVESGVDVNSCDEHGSGTLLTFHPEIAAYLLAHGADPNVQTNENGASVLAGLAFVNQAGCVRLLLEHGADPNRGRAATGETPLHFALAGARDSRETELVRLLLDHGADVNAQTKPGVSTSNFWRDVRTRGETPLHRAAAYASLETIEAMLEAGTARTISRGLLKSPLGRP